MKINLDDAEIISVNESNNKNHTSIRQEKSKNVREKLYKDRTNWDEYNWRTDDWLEMDEEMKIRLDYVSNSSTSSFFILGHEFEINEFTEALKAKGVKNKQLDELGDYVDDDKFHKKFGLDAVVDFENDVCYVGLSFASMGDDETKRQFIERSAKGLKDLFDEDIKVEDICGDIYC